MSYGLNIEMHKQVITVSCFQSLFNSQHLVVCGSDLFFRTFFFFFFCPGGNSEETEWHLCSGAALPVTRGNDVRTCVNMCLQILTVNKAFLLFTLHSGHIVQCTQTLNMFLRFILIHIF